MSYFSSSKTHFSTLSINFHIISLIPLFILHYFLSKYYEIIFYFFPNTPPTTHTSNPHPNTTPHAGDPLPMSTTNHHQQQITQTHSHHRSTTQNLHKPMELSSFNNNTEPLSATKTHVDNLYPQFQHKPTATVQTQIQLLHTNPPHMNQTKPRKKQ